MAPSGLDRNQVRKLLNETLRTDSDLEAFCLDHFPEVQRRFSRGMDRTAKVNLLFEVESNLDLIVAKLHTPATPAPAPARRKLAARLGLGGVMLLGVVAAVWWGLVATRQGHTLPGSSEKVYGSCAPWMVQSLFAAAAPGQPELRALIVRFSGDNDDSAALGVRVGSSLRGTLEDHVRTELKSE